MSSSSFSSSEDLDPSIQPTPDPTLERLVSASSSGNLPSVEATFEEWKSSQDPVARASSQAPNYAMQPALEAAALKSHLDIVAYFLAEGFHITEEVVRNAIRAPSIAASNSSSITAGISTADGLGAGSQRSGIQPRLPPTP